MIDRDYLEKRKRELEQGIKQLEANITANRGALAIVEEMLKQVEEHPPDAEN